jgi:hypothetical protein
VETILSGKSDWIGTDLMEELVRHPLDCVGTEFPHSVWSIDSPDGIERPKEQHPVFYGCCDWHSSVHSHWSLIRQLRLFDEHPRESEIVQSIESRITSENVEREVEYFETNDSVEKPYGWAWFLCLISELYLWEDDAENDWETALNPLEERIVDLVETEFLSQARPFRVGTHHNSAFALQCVLDYARVTANDALEYATLETSKRFFTEDKDYPVEYEPLGWDFLSPSLAEADLMRRVLAQDELVTWMDEFLPNVTESPYNTILDPVEVKPDGGIELHLVGLNVSKAWCMAGIASALDDHRYTETFERSAKRHAKRGLEQAFTEDYAGAHWLSSYVLYLLTRNEGAITPE